MSLLPCLKQPFILGNTIAPSKTFLPYTRKKGNKKEFPLAPGPGPPKM